VAFAPQTRNDLPSTLSSASILKRRRWVP
jgi:hypothetical protein